MRGPLYFSHQYFFPVPYDITGVLKITFEPKTGTQLLLISAQMHRNFFPAFEQALVGV